MKITQIVLFIVIFLFSPIEAALQVNYYANTCPNLERIVRDVVQAQHNQSVKVAPSTLRLFFHDCFVKGCDASIMIENSTGNDERHSADDITLANDAFDTILAAKKAIDEDPRCTNKVSCADIMALTARDSVNLSGRPWWQVELGRYDGKLSTKDGVVLPHSDDNLDKLTQVFANLGLDQTDMIALSGGHTFGIARCEFFKNRIYPKVDPSMDPVFAEIIRAMCPPDTQDGTKGAFLDFTTKGEFDNAYYKNLQGGRGLLASDQVLYTDPRSQETVKLFASNQAAFFEAFTKSMVKLGRVGVKTVLDGEIRRDCRFPN